MWQVRSSKKAAYLIMVCMVLLLAGVVIVLTQNALTRNDYLYDESEKTDWSHCPTDCIVGTWKSTTTGDLLTIEKDGNITITLGNTAHDSDTSDIFFHFLDVNSTDETEDMKEYLNENNQSLMEKYLPKNYYYGQLDCYHPQDPPQYDNGIMLCDQYVGLLLYLPREWYDSDEPQKPGTELMAYHRADGSTEGYYDSYILQS